MSIRNVVVTDPDTGKSTLASGEALIEITATAVVPSNERAVEIPETMASGLNSKLWRKGSIKVAPDGTFTGCETARSCFRRDIKNYTLPLSSLTYLVRARDEARMQKDVQNFRARYEATRLSVVSNWDRIVANWQSQFSTTEQALMRSVTPSATDIDGRFHVSVGQVEIQPHGQNGLDHVEDAVLDMTALGFQRIASAIAHGKAKGKGYLRARQDLLNLAQQIGNFTDFSVNAQKLEAVVRYCAVDALVESAYGELSDSNFLRSCLRSNDVPDRLFVKSQTVVQVPVPVPPAVTCTVSEPDETGAVTATATLVDETTTITCVGEGPKARPLPEEEPDPDAMDLPEPEGSVDLPEPDGSGEPEEEDDHDEWASDIDWL